MVILIFKGNKDENPKIFLREYKRIYISIGFKTVVKWVNFFSKFLKGTHWFE